MPGRPMLTVEAVRSLLRDLGWDLLSGYQGTRSKIRVRCGAGHESDLFLQNLRKGQQCSKCGKDATRRVRARREFKKRGLTLMEDYRNGYTPLSCRCSRCRRWHRLPLNAVLSGRTCDCVNRDGG